ncbi:hypothetical protein FDECE_10477 [Fusarium decemcellulare]|nr:hypothetical protein FDECE_10477 [Fusarium decemcellulare]
MSVEHFPSGDSLSSSEITKLGRHGYVVGKKLSSSWAPFLHDIVFRGLGLPWGQVRLELEDMGAFMKLVHHPDFFAILPYLDELTDECRDIGACNTVYFRESQGRRVLCGANTDAIGIRDSFYQKIGIQEQTFHGRPALVIGSGGAARSAVYALRKWMNVTTIYIVNRDRAEVSAVLEDCSRQGYGDNLMHVETVPQALGLDAPGAIISCIPDYEPQTNEEIMARKVVEAFLNNEIKGYILEMCYNPSPLTRLSGSARERGWELILGTEALIWQGLEQDRLWTGRDIDEELIRKVKIGVAHKVKREK